MSTKKYTVISADINGKKRLPADILGAIRRDFYVVNKDYIYDTIEAKKSISLELYALNLKKYISKTTRQVTMDEIHFKKTRKFTSSLKTAKKTRPRKKSLKKVRMPRNPVQFFVANKILERKSRPLTAKEHRNSVSQFFLDWKHLPSPQKHLYKTKWRNTKIVKTE